jgi:hypothetical protein
LVAEAVSGSVGIARFTDIAFGLYTIREIEAPAKYVKSDEVLEADITSDGVVRNIRSLTKEATNSVGNGAGEKDRR